MARPKRPKSETQRAESDGVVGERMFPSQPAIGSGERSVSFPSGVWGAALTNWPFRNFIGLQRLWCRFWSIYFSEIFVEFEPQNALTSTTNFCGVRTPGPRGIGVYGLLLLFLLLLAWTLTANIVLHPRPTAAQSLHVQRLQLPLLPGADALSNISWKISSTSVHKYMQALNMGTPDLIWAWCPYLEPTWCPY